MNPRRLASSLSAVVPVMRTGRLCGVSVSSAPKVIAISAPTAVATSSTAVQNVRHLSCGSTPCRKTTSRRPLGSGAAENWFVGQSMWRTPSTSRTWGRVEVKSKKSSPSMDAKGRAFHAAARYLAAADAASPASLHPSKAATSTGRRSCGCRSHVTNSTRATVLLTTRIPAPRPTLEAHDAWRARPFLARDAGLVRSDLRRADRGPGAGMGRHLTREARADPGADRVGQDAGRLPLAHRSPAHRTGDRAPLPGPVHLAPEGAQL